MGADETLSLPQQCAVFIFGGFAVALFFACAFGIVALLAAGQNRLARGFAQWLGHAAVKPGKLPIPACKRQRPDSE
jgi:hypothetical protein